MNSCSIPFSTEKWLSVSTSSVLSGSIQGEIISRPTWPPPGGVPMITGPHSPGVVVLLVVVEALVARTPGVVGTPGIVGALELVEEGEVVTLVAAQSVELPVVVPVSAGTPLGVVVVAVTVSVAVTTGVVVAPLGLVLVLVVERDGVEVEPPVVGVGGRFG